MNQHPIFRLLWRLANTTIVLFGILLLLTTIWEFSTRQYLKGFASGIVIPESPAQAKVTAIMLWMENNSGRSGAGSTDLLTVRDPEDTLNSGKLLGICGSATNAFVNLANSSGIPARRLLLLNAGNTANHVVAEVQSDGHWYVVDPVFHIIPHGPDGQWLTASDLRDSTMLASITHGIPAYRPDYNYQRTAHLRLSRVPVIGPFAGRILNHLWPDWDGDIFWTLLTERESFAAFVGVMFLLLLLLLLHIAMRFYGRRRLGMSRVELVCPLHPRPAPHTLTTGRA